jgi:hypothetical protein
MANQPDVQYSPMSSKEEALFMRYEADAAPPVYMPSTQEWSEIKTHEAAIFRASPMDMPAQIFRKRAAATWNPESENWHIGYDTAAYFGYHTLRKAPFLAPSHCVIGLYDSAAYAANSLSHARIFEVGLELGKESVRAYPTAIKMGYIMHILSTRYARNKLADRAIDKGFLVEPSADDVETLRKVLARGFVVASKPADAE